jgi:hypothetical protein
MFSNIEEGLHILKTELGLPMRIHKPFNELKHYKLANGGEMDLTKEELIAKFAALRGDEAD